MDSFIVCLPKKTNYCNSNNNKLVKRPNILIVDNSLAYTGAFKAILSTSVALSEYYNFIFILPKKSTISQLVKSKNIPVITLPFVELSRSYMDIVLYFPALLLNGFRLSRLAADYDAIIIHVNDFYNLSGSVAKLFFPSVKLVTHIRKMPDSFPSFIKRIWLEIHKRLSDQIIAVSKAVIKQLDPSYPAHLVYDGISEKEKYPPKDFSSKSSYEIRLLYLGHFIPGKGQDYALEAFRDAYRKCNNIRLRFIGGDMGLKKNMEFKESLEEKAKKWNITEVVEFREYSPDTEKEIKKADIVLNFSESESFSFTCLEALYYGTPLIASDSGGPAELCKSGYNGLLVPIMDTEEMSKAIVHLSLDEETRKRYSTNGIKFVRKVFLMERTAMKFNQFYNKILRLDYD